MKSRSALSLNRLDSNSPAYPSSMQADQRSQSDVFCGLRQRAKAPKLLALPYSETFSQKIALPSWRHAAADYFRNPAGSGPRSFSGWFSYFWDCKLELNFVPAWWSETKIIVGARIEFFWRPEVAAAAGSLKSTYRVVNTTF